MPAAPTVLRALLSVVVAALHVIIVGYLTIRASMSRGGLSLDLANAPLRVQEPAVPWAEYLLIAVVSVTVVALAGRRVLLPAVAAVTGLALTVLLLVTGPSGQLNPFLGEQSGPLVWATRGADSPAVHVTVLVLAWLILDRRRTATAPD